MTANTTLENLPFGTTQVADVDLEIEYTVSRYFPGRTNGYADDCYPEEGGECEIGKVRVVKAMIYASLESDAGRLATADELKQAQAVVDAKDSEAWWDQLVEVCMEGSDT